MLEAWPPAFAKHAFKNANDLGADIGLAGWIGQFKGVESYWMVGVGRVEIDNVFNARLGDEAKVVDGKITVGVDDAIALIVKNVRESKELKETRFASTSLANDINVAGAVATKKSKLVIDAAEVGEAKGGNIFVGGGVTSDEGEFGGGLGGFGRCPDDVGGFHGGVR